MEKKNIFYDDAKKKKERETKTEKKKWKKGEKNEREKRKKKKAERKLKKKRKMRKGQRCIKVSCHRMMTLAEEGQISFISEVIFHLSLRALYTIISIKGDAKR